MAPKPPPPVHMIDVSGASKTFGNVVAVSDVSFTLDAGVTALLGQMVQGSQHCSACYVGSPHPP